MNMWGVRSNLGKLGTGDYIGVKHTLIRLTVLEFFWRKFGYGDFHGFPKMGVPAN